MYMYVYTYNYMERYLSRTLPEGECLIWQGWKNEKGYPLCEVRGKKHRVQRLIYEFFKGEIPDGFVTDHLCRNRACINPNHLEAVTNLENIRRGIPKNRGKQICDSGHLFDEKNTYIRPDGKRACRKCRYISHKNWRAKCKPQSI